MTDREREWHKLIRSIRTGKRERIRKTSDGVESWRHCARLPLHHDHDFHRDLSRPNVKLGQLFFDQTRIFYDFLKDFFRVFNPKPHASACFFTKLVFFMFF